MSTLCFDMNRLVYLLISLVSLVAVVGGEHFTSIKIGFRNCGSANHKFSM